LPSPDLPTRCSAMDPAGAPPPHLVILCRQLLGYALAWLDHRAVAASTAELMMKRDLGVFTSQTSESRCDLSISLSLSLSATHTHALTCSLFLVYCPSNDCSVVGQSPGGVRTNLINHQLIIPTSTCDRDNVIPPPHPSPMDIANET